MTFLSFPNSTMDAADVLRLSPVFTVCKSPAPNVATNPLRSVRSTVGHLSLAKIRTIFAGGSLAKYAPAFPSEAVIRTAFWPELTDKNGPSVGAVVKRMEPVRVPAPMRSVLADKDVLVVPSELLNDI